jgi:hypothetical protein
LNELLGRASIAVDTGTNPNGNTQYGDDGVDGYITPSSRPGMPNRLYAGRGLYPAPQTQQNESANCRNGQRNRETRKRNQDPSRG